MVKAKAKIVFGIAGVAASEETGTKPTYGFFSGTQAAVLQLLLQKAMLKENIIMHGHDGTNYYLFYKK